MKRVYLFFVFIICLHLNGQIVNFTDNNLKAKLLAANPSNTIARGIDNAFIKIDVNNDAEIQVLEAQAVYWLNLDNTPAGNNDIINLVGLQDFTNVWFLSCNYNSISNLSLSNLANLTHLQCSYNGMLTLNLSDTNNLSVLLCQNNNLSALNLSNFPNLIELNCSQNSNLTTVTLSNLNSFKKLAAFYCQINSLNLSNLPLFEEIAIQNNSLTNLNLSTFTSLKYIQCSNNLLSSLNVPASSNLISLSCGNNQLTQLNVSNLPNLTTLICPVNQISSLNVSNSPLLTLFYCFNNNLNQLYVKNGVNYVLQNINGTGNGYKLFSNPDLTYVCADDNKINSLVNYFNLPSIVINSYCSFSPGGDLYTIQGNVMYDSNQNGCGTGDPSLPFLQLSILNGQNYSGYINSVSSGSYSLQMNSGAYTVSPQLENPNYFTTTPVSFTANFPSDASPTIQDFCLTANGIHNDLEVIIIPYGIARPGDNAVYKIIYKNKGTSIQTGLLNFVFNDATTDLISSNPSPSNQTVNNLNWNFSNLQPLEIRQILVTFNLNSPTETPPLNSGNVLNFSGTISGLADETPTNNSFLLNQLVVNSFDPNDKICLEGTTIPPTKVGDYVHYRIRFENTGTANAQNIVVKDMIDTAKFDVSTLIPLDASHSFVTRITNTNQVEFVFQNIQLPFDDANNDGYVVFKIKTKPTLVLGDTFSNTASIYFDYNFPIITNTYTTTVAALANQDFEFDTYFTLYPNPTKAVMNVNTKDTIEMSSISIYTILGQLMMVIPNAKETTSIDVSALTKGNYFIKIVSDKGTSNAKFIKE